MTAQHPATHLGCQLFHFAAYRWCVTRAQELITADPTVATLHEHARIERLAALLPGAALAPGAVPLVRVAVDTEYAMSTDLTVPLIVAPLRSVSGETFYGSLVIDGWHRVYHALSLGLTSLPAHVLSPAAEEAARYPFPFFPQGPR